MMQPISDHLVVRTKFPTLWLCQQFAIEAMAIEMVDLPNKHGWIFQFAM